MSKRMILFFVLVLACSGCDRIYGFLHKPGGEEREVLGEYSFNAHSSKVEELQKLLKLLGYGIGRPDGRFGAGTREAVARFQSDEELKVTRFVDKATWEHLQVYAVSPFFHKGEISGKAVQKALIKAGYDPGKMDGKIGQKTRDALKEFQQARGLLPDGYIGLKTLKALAEYLPQSLARPQAPGGAPSVAPDAKPSAGSGR